MRIAQFKQVHVPNLARPKPAFREYWKLGPTAHQKQVVHVER